MYRIWYVFINTVVLVLAAVAYGLLFMGTFIFLAIASGLDSITRRLEELSHD